MRSLGFNFTRAVICHAEQSVITVSEFSESIFYGSSSFLAEAFFHNTIIAKCTF